MMKYALMLSLLAVLLLASFIQARAGTYTVTTLDDHDDGSF
jgi:hypothetical protein